MSVDDHYKESIAAFETAAFEAARVSRAAAGREAANQPAWWASVLFTRLTVTSISLLCLVPRSKFAGTFVEHFDFSAVASMTRNLWESYFVFFYLCVDKTDDDEWFTRLNVLQLHDCVTRFKMFRELDPNDPNLPGFQAQADDLRARLNGRAYFTALSPKRRAHVLRGDHALMASQDELLTKMGEDVATFRGVYRFMSAHVHTLPLGFYRMAEREQGRGVESDWEKESIAMALEFGLTPLQRALEEMGNLFPDTRKP